MNSYIFLTWGLNIIIYLYILREFRELKIHVSKDVKINSSYVKEQFDSLGKDINKLELECERILHINKTLIDSINKNTYEISKSMESKVK